MKSGNINFLEPSGPLQACNGIALPFTSLSAQTIRSYRTPLMQSIKLFEERRKSFNFTFADSVRRTVPDITGMSSLLNTQSAVPTSKHLLPPQANLLMFATLCMAKRLLKAEYFLRFMTSPLFWYWRSYIAVKLVTTEPFYSTPFVSTPTLVSITLTPLCLLSTNYYFKTRQVLEQWSVNFSGFAPSI